MATTTESFTAGAGQVLYPFTIQYLKESDINIAIDGTATTSYTFANATTIQLNSAPTTGAEVVISRLTSVELIDSSFFPGSSIRAQDLNENFQQLLFNAQEADGFVPLYNAVFPDDVSIGNHRITSLANPTDSQDAVNKQFLESVTWDNATETTNSSESWTGNDANIATTGAIDGRINVKIDEAITNDIAGQDGVNIINDGDGSITVGLSTNQVDLAKINSQNIDATNDSWSNSDNNIATTAKIDDVIDLAIENDINVDSTGLSKSVANGQVTLGISSNSVDFDRVKATDIITTSGYASTWSNVNDKLVTPGAVAARLDAVISSSQPTTSQIGKFWYNPTEGINALYVWDGSIWKVLSSGTPFIPAGTTIVRYVDAINGSDAVTNNGFLPQSPLQTIGRAIDLINASSSGDGTLVVVEPGVYQETLPLTIQKNNISIVGKSLRSCFIHPTVATENNNMWEVDSGTYITGFTMLGLKVPTSDQGTRNNAVDNDATYGLPSNQPFAISFRSGDPVILKSPYIQNCTHFSDAHFDNANFDPNTFPATDGQPVSAVAGDQSSAPSGGGLLVDGSVPAVSSPIRSMVVDSFTQIALDGPGILVTNNGYAQLVSFFGTFCHYHAKAKNGGQINLTNCVTDFGRYGLIADGKSPVPIATATVNAASLGDTNITIGAITTETSFHGTVLRPLDHMLVTIDNVDYPIISSTANGSGWDIVLGAGLTSTIGNTTVGFSLRSYISTGGHTFEFVGVGTHYGNHPDNGGFAIEANQVTQLNSGRVWQSSTDHIGKFKAGTTLVVDQVLETVALLDTSITGNLSITGTVDNRDVASDGTKLDGIEASADVTNAANVDAAGAVMNSDVSTSAMSFVVDEDNMSSNTSTKVPTQQSVKAYVDSEISGLIDTAPAALDTLNELAAALNDDSNFATSVTNSISALQSDVDANELASDNAEAALSGRLNTLETDPTTAAAVAAVQADVDANETASDAAEAALSGRLAVLEADPTTATAVAAVQADVNQNESDADAALALRLPLSGGTMTGNIVMSGTETVDGRDLSADGSKLDGIESSATGDQTATEIRTLVESASDSNVFTDADHSKLNAIAAGAEVNVNADWNASSGDAQILNKPTFTYYTDSSVDTHLNRSSATTGEILSWNGTDYDWVAPTAAVTDGDKGDIVVSGSGSIWSLDYGGASTNSVRKITTSTSSPSGGSDGDIWIKYTP